MSGRMARVNPPLDTVLAIPNASSFIHDEQETIRFYFSNDYHEQTVTNLHFQLKH